MNPLLDFGQEADGFIFLLSYKTDMQDTAIDAPLSRKHQITFLYTGRLPFNGIIDSALTTELLQRL